jgi:hypothetical protein
VGNERGGGLRRVLRREKIGREVSWCSGMLRPDAVTELQDTVDSSIKQLVRGSASCEAVYVQPTLFDPMTPLTALPTTSPQLRSSLGFIVKTWSLLVNLPI